MSTYTKRQRLSTPGTIERPLCVAVIGSGPSGFYAAEALLKAPNLTVRVDLFDRLPTPFGLVRGGVAPDHQKIKAVTATYEKVAADPRVRFFGNVKLGRDLSVEDLRARYDQIVYAVGCESDRPMGVPGEALDGSFAATDLVGWYNGHPDHRRRSEGDHGLEATRRSCAGGHTQTAGREEGELGGLRPMESSRQDRADQRCGTWKGS